MNLLKYFIENPNTILQDIKNKENLEKEQIDNKYKSLKILLKKKLLTESYDRIRKKKIYKVSNIGIFYLILEWKTFGMQTQKKLLLNYDDFVIFKLFVYPYISYGSILKIEDSDVFSNIFVYLKKCCMRVKDTLFGIEHTYNSYNGYQTNQVFIWNKQSTDTPSYFGLKSFLTYYLNLSWIDKADVIKDYQDKNIIKISDGFNTGIIKIPKDKSEKAILIIKGTKAEEFIVREMKGTDDYSIESFVYNDNNRSSRVTIRELHLKSLIMATQQEVQILIFSIFLGYGIDMEHPLYDILKKDKIFIQSLDKTKQYFNQRYKDIIE